MAQKINARYRKGGFFHAPGKKHIPGSLIHKDNALIFKPKEGSILTVAFSDIKIVRFNELEICIETKDGTKHFFDLFPDNMRKNLLWVSALGRMTPGGAGWGKTNKEMLHDDITVVSKGRVIPSESWVKLFEEQGVPTKPFSLTWIVIPSIIVAIIVAFFII